MSDIPEHPFHSYKNDTYQWKLRREAGGLPEWLGSEVVRSELSSAK